MSSRPEFADRKTNYTIYGKPVNNEWFSVDFTLAELKTLGRVQPLHFRNQNYNGLYKIATFEEYIAVAKKADRKIGIYPETKHPDWVNSLSMMNGTRFEDILLSIVHKHGYTEKTDPCLLQSFSYKSLVYMANRTHLPLLMNLEEGSVIEDTDFKRYAEICYGVGTSKDLVIPTDAINNLKPPTDFVKRANAAGLKVHVATFRNEDRYLAWDFDQDARSELDMFFRQRIDGFFTDFPKSFNSYLYHKYSDNCAVSSGLSVQALNGAVLFLVTIFSIFIK